TPVVVGAAISGPPPPAPSMQRKAICLPSCDQRGRAAYPFRFVSFLDSEPSGFTVHSWRCAPCPAPEKNASVIESGAHAGSKSVLSPTIGSLVNITDPFRDVSRT